MQTLPPPPDPHEALWWWQAVRGAAYATFASVAGLLGYLLRTLDAGSQVSWGRAVLESLSAGMVGMFVMWICQSANLSQQWTAVSVGVSGWLGANASIQVLQRLVWNKLGLTRSQVNDDPE
ncbi:MAG TPA: phage holin family protein [Telluria sp.]|nr:phage holin family protein [Telluria sp.]